MYIHFYMVIYGLNIYIGCLRIPKAIPDTKFVAITSLTEGIVAAK